MPMSFNFSYSENFLVLFYFSFHFILTQDGSKRDEGTKDWCPLEALKGGVAMFHPHRHYELLVSAEECGHRRTILRVFHQLRLVLAILQSSTLNTRFCTLSCKMSLIRATPHEANSVMEFNRV